LSTTAGSALRKIKQGEISSDRTSLRLGFGDHAPRMLVDRLGKDVLLEPRPIDPGLLKEAKRALHVPASDIKRASKQSMRKLKLKLKRNA
jgi:hypothetical protein